MHTHLKRHATTLTTALFLISGVSGFFLFFGIGKDIFKSMHEWLSIALLIVAGLHIWKNWLPMTLYFKRNAIWLPLAASLSVAAFLMAPSLMGSESGGNPLYATAMAIENSTVAEVAPIYNLTPEALTEYLTNNGYQVSSADQTLLDIAKQAGQDNGREIFYITANAK